MCALFKCRHEESTQYQGKFHLLGMNTMELCLETSTNRKLTSSELEISSLVPCKKNTNQVCIRVLHDKCSR